MTPEEFIKKWRDSERKERQASQQHFLDLCDVLEVPKPGDPGIKSKDYDFAIRLKKPGQKDGESNAVARKQGLEKFDKAMAIKHRLWSH